MRLLQIVQNFRQGQGGAPESARLMARGLAQYGVTSDVFDTRTLFEQVERLDCLPESQASGRLFSPKREIPFYDVIFIVGPWQNFISLNRIFSHLSTRQKVFYLPRGGLADIEFAGRRNLKKHIYFPLFESRILKRTNGIIFSSHHEMEQSGRLTKLAPHKIIIPDLFEKLPNQDDTPMHSLRLSFLAEIDPRKGLMELMAGLHQWRPVANFELVQVTLAGWPRPGREHYYHEAMQAASSLASMNVSFPGRIAHGDRRGFYAGTDIFLVPSRMESFGLTVLEALSSGCVVICGPGVGVLEFLPDFPALVRLPDLSPAAIALGMEKAVKALSQVTRSQISAFADDAVSRINAQALAAWREACDLS